MAALLQIVGFAWAAIGAYNLYLQDWSTPEATAGNSFAVILNMVLFIIPGLILGGMGHSMQKRQKSTASKPVSSIQQRLAQLDDLLASRAVSRDEYDRRREQILRDV